MVYDFENEEYPSSRMDGNPDGSMNFVDPAMRARKFVGMERRDIITAVLGTFGALGVLVGLGLAGWLYLRARRSKERDGDLEEQNESGEGTSCSHAQQTVKKNGFLNLKTPLISTKALGNETIPYVLAYRTRVFIDITEPSTFWLISVYQGPMAIFAVYMAATIGYVFSLALHVCGKLSVLVFRIKKLDLESIESDGSLRAAVFRDILKKHLEVLEMAEDINQVFGLVMLEELLICTLLVGLTIYHVLQNVDFNETALFLTYLSYGLTVLVLIYGYCVAGEYLITESGNLCDAYYQCQWYDMSESFKKQLAICMIGATKPIYLNAGGFYIFSLASFMSIVKSAAGYISMLRTMN